MRNSAHYIFLGLFLFAVACAPRAKSVDVAMFERHKYTNHHAVGFQILQLPDSSATLLRVAKAPLNSLSRADSIIVLLEGQEPPADFGGGVICGEARRIIALSAEGVAMLDSLGVADRVVGVAYADSVANPIVSQRYEEGKVLALRRGEGLDLDAVVALHPDIILLDEQADGDVGLKRRLSQLGIPYIYINAAMEMTSLAKDEWLVALAQIVGRDELARRYYEELLSRRERLFRRTIELLRMEKFVVLPTNSDSI